MSAADSKQTAVDAGSVASRTRRQTRQRARSDDQDEKQSTQSSAHVSPAMRIYRHALESIFAMLELEDLSRALAVSRSWSAAVRSMQPIRAAIEGDFGDEDEIDLLPPIDLLVASPLMRHISALHAPSEDYDRLSLTTDDVGLLSTHAANLASLWCTLDLAPEDDPVAWPPKLTSLELELVDEPSAATINSVLATLATLPRLQRLVFTAPSDLTDVDFSLLAASASLTDLSLDCESGEAQELSDEQMAQFRSSLGHLRSLKFIDLDETSLPRLLQPPVTARWQSIGLVFADAHTGDLLTTLPSLTRLDLSFGDDVPHADFLRRLPLLTALDLDFLQRGAALAAGVRSWHIPNEALLTSLLPCTGLTELDLHCGFKSAHLDALFKSLTKLKRLRLWCSLDSLRCFASGPITQSLKSLFIDQIEPLPIAELDHLYALQRLHSLDLNDSFVLCLPSVTIDSLLPPTALFPRLTKFSCIRSRKPDDWVERTGMSFEWTQQRLTQ